MAAAFGGDPELVAEEYADAILDLTKPETAGRGAGKLVVINFAIHYAGHGWNNYEVFKRVLGAKLNGPLGLTKRGIDLDGTLHHGTPPPLVLVT